MLNIAFVIPRDTYNYSPLRNQPLVELYLLTILKEHFGKKINGSIIDLRQTEEKSITGSIPKNDVFLYSVTSPNFEEISKVVRMLRIIYPEAKHIAGGGRMSIFSRKKALCFLTVLF